MIRTFYQFTMFSNIYYCSFLFPSGFFNQPYVGSWNNPYILKFSSSFPPCCLSILHSEFFFSVFFQFIDFLFSCVKGTEFSNVIITHIFISKSSILFFLIHLSNILPQALSAWGALLFPCVQTLCCSFFTAFKPP